MNHDATHCADYRPGQCPKDCYRAQLTKEYYDRALELSYLPVSFAHLSGTDECPKGGGHEDSDH